MSPEILTLVAAVLAYDMAREMCDLRSSIEATDAVRSGPARRSAAVALSRKERSCTSVEKDMILESASACACYRRSWVVGRRSPRELNPPGSYENGEAAPQDFICADGDWPAANFCPHHSTTKRRDG